MQQNTAMRTMLGAPRWSSACVMQSETDLVPLTTRVKQIVAYRVAIVLQLDAEGLSLRRLQQAMTRGAPINTRNITTPPTQITGPGNSLTSLPPPTAPHPHGRPLQQSTPPLLSPLERSFEHHALMAMARVTEVECVIIIPTAR